MKSLYMVYDQEMKPVRSFLKNTKSYRLKDRERFYVGTYTIVYCGMVKVESNNQSLKKVA